MNPSKSIQTQSALSLGLSFLITGIGFALPFLLFPGFEYSQKMNRAPEILNLFCLVAWMGLSHFTFAYQGHFRTVARSRSFFAKYIIVLIVSTLLLFSLRASIGVAIFSSIAWLYFISHLLKAEMYFSGVRDWQVFVLPLLAFSFFSFALLAPDIWVQAPYLFGGLAICLVPFAIKSVRTKLGDSFSRPLLLIAMFLIGEGLIWGKYRPYMTPEFRDGVYTIHVALASFYHYFKSYEHMRARGQSSILKILLVHFAVIGMGFYTLHYLRETAFIYLFGVQYFTVWVWLHQWMSDAFNWMKPRI